MMKIAITGAYGEIGSRLCRLGYIPLNLDVTEPFSVKDELERVRPDVILHCAGMSSVDQCQADLDAAIKVNVRGTFNVCEEASEVGAKVVLLSSDYIFDGEKGNYKEDDDWNPINNYGLSKVGAEAVIRVHEGKVVRISRTFSINSPDISEYIKTILLKPEKPIYVPDFIYRSYCHADLMVKSLDYYLKNFENMPGTLNISGSEPVSYFEFIYRIMDSMKVPHRKVEPRTEDLETETPRPHRLGLDISLALSLGVPIFSTNGLRSF